MMTTPICPRLLNMINDFVLLRFRDRTPEDLSAIEVIYLLLLLLYFEYDAVLHRQPMQFLQCRRNAAVF